MKKELLDVLEDGEFSGSLAKLQELAREHQDICKWVDYGTFVRLQLKHSQKMYFWPETGRILHCCYDSLGPARQSELDWWLIRSPEAKHRRWRTYTFPKFGKLSLPQLFLQRPGYAFKSIVQKHGGPIDEFDYHELAELFDKISTIRIPRRFSKEARAIVSYSGYNSESTGFEVTEQPVWEARTKRIWVARHIDLYRAAFSFYERQYFFSPIPSLMALFARDPAAVWDRQECEAFFNSSRNFLTPAVEFDRQRAQDDGKRILG